MIQGKIVFDSIQYKNGCLAASDVFIFLHIKGYICLKNIINCKNEWLFLSASFTAKFELYFVLTLENNFSLRFHFKAN